MGPLMVTLDVQELDQERAERCRREQQSSDIVAGAYG